MLLTLLEDSAAVVCRKSLTAAPTLLPQTVLRWRRQSGAPALRTKWARPGAPHLAEVGRHAPAGLNASMTMVRAPLLTRA